MKLLCGTTNEAKMNSIKRAVQPLGIHIMGLNDLNCAIPQVAETGTTLLENARINANAYYEAFHMPVFSCDSGLYFDEVREDQQPGIYVRRVQGRELSDEEMIEYYGALARQYGGTLTARYRNAICLILDETTSYESMDLSLATEPFLLVSQPHPRRVEGFPLDALSKDIKSGIYYYDMQEKDVSSGLENGVQRFFAQALKGR